MHVIFHHFCGLAAHGGNFVLFREIHRRIEGGQRGKRQHFHDNPERKRVSVTSFVMLYNKTILAALFFPLQGFHDASVKLFPVEIFQVVMSIIRRFAALYHGKAVCNMCPESTLRLVQSIPQDAAQFCIKTVNVSDRFK